MAKMTGKQRKALAAIALELKDRIENGSDGDAPVSIREMLECTVSYFWDAVRAAFGSDQGVLDVMCERDQMAESVKGD